MLSMRHRYLELFRYVVNGLMATAVHYAVLNFNLNVLHFNYAGVANAIAALFGISASFIGVRYFVFEHTSKSLASQLIQFSGLYIILALMQGAILYCWADRLGYDYRVGFLIATAFQFCASYVGNKLWVFKK